jgi:hypothetical protein
MENRNRIALRADHDETDRTLDVEAEHNRWWNTVDEYLSDDEGTRNIIKAHQVTLLVLRFESVLALHRSVLATSQKNSAYNAALQRCISASRSIINTLHKALRGFGAFDGSPGQNGYESTPLVWPSFTWAVWMSVFIVVFAASEGQFARETALRLADRSIQILQHLALRGTNWPEACIVAVQNLTARLREGSTRSSTTAPGPSQGQNEQPISQASNGRNISASRDQGNQLPTNGHERIRTGYITPRRAMMPPVMPHNPFHQSVPLSQNFVNNNPAQSFPNLLTPLNNSGPSHAASAYLGGAGTFLGIAQQSSDNPIPNDEIMHLFNGEDMGFWSGENLGYGGNFMFHE